MPGKGPGLATMRQEPLSQTLHRRYFTGVVRELSRAGWRPVRAQRKAPLAQGQWGKASLVSLTGCYRTFLPGPTFHITTSVGCHEMYQAPSDRRQVRGWRPHQFHTP